jgi:hypothetical protein
MTAKEPGQFLHALTGLPLSSLDRAIALLWWHGLQDTTATCSSRDLARELEAAGYGQQNVSRLGTALAVDSRTTKTRQGLFRISATARKALDEKYLALVHEKPVPRSSTVLPLDLVTGTRQYIERVVLQLNASYDFGLFDCCAVMCRRLLETLIIEVYEAAGRADELKGADGNFMMFAGLLGKLDKDKAFNLGRNSLRGLRDFKALGDQSAHDRRFNARADDIDRVRSGLRTATEELLTLARLTS